MSCVPSEEIDWGYEGVTQDVACLPCVYSPGTMSGCTCQLSRRLGKRKQGNPKFRVLLGDVRFASINNGTREERKEGGRKCGGKC